MTTPIAQWDFNETSGTTAVATIGGIDGTYNNGTGAYTLGENSLTDVDPTGKSVRLAGGAYVEMPSNAIFDSTSLTITFTMKLHSYSTTAGSAMVSRSGIGTTSGSEGIVVYSFLALNTITLCTFSGNTIVSNNKALSVYPFLEQRYHVAVSISPSGQYSRVFINGLGTHPGDLVATPAWAFNNQVIRVGRPLASAWNNIDFTIDQLQWYNVRLPEWEIKQLAKAALASDPAFYMGEMRDVFSNPLELQMMPANRTGHNVDNAQFSLEPDIHMAYKEPLLINGVGGIGGAAGRTFIIRKNGIPSPNQRVLLKSEDSLHIYEVRYTDENGQVSFDQYNPNVKFRLVAEDYADEKSITIREFHMVQPAV